MEFCKFVWIIKFTKQRTHQYLMILQHDIKRNISRALKKSWVVYHMKPIRHLMKRNQKNADHKKYLKKTVAHCSTGDDLTGALHVLQLHSTPPSPVKSRMVTLWYQVTRASSKMAIKWVLLLLLLESISFTISKINCALLTIVGVSNWVFREHHHHCLGLPQVHAT